MIHKIVLQGRFDDLNDYISELYLSRKHGEALKRKNESRMIIEIRKQLPGVKFDNPIRIHYSFYEPDKRRDISNVCSFFVKCFEDSLQKCKVISNDGWANIDGYSQEFYVDKDMPRVEISVKEVKI